MVIVEFCAGREAQEKYIEERDRSSYSIGVSNSLCFHLLARPPRVG
jgi:hypothetical protein